MKEYVCKNGEIVKAMIDPRNYVGLSSYLAQTQADRAKKVVEEIKNIFSQPFIHLCGDLC